MPTVLTFKKLTEGSQNKFKVVQRVEEIRMKTTNYVKKNKNNTIFKLNAYEPIYPVMISTVLCKSSPGQ